MARTTYKDIPKEVKDKVYDRFWKRDDNYVIDIMNETGLSKHIVNRIIDEHKK
ncbi:MAG: hypothetical protein AB3N18_04640 [Allomuricauda sp.]